MAAVWLLLGKTRFPAEFIESSKQAGVKTAEVPFDIAAELVPSLFESADRKLIARSEERPSGEARFGISFIEAPRRAASSPGLERPP